MLSNQHYPHRANQKLRSWANAVFQNRGVCGQAVPSFPSPSPVIHVFLLLSQLSRRTSRGNACYAGYAFSEAKHSATGSLNLKRDKYYKHRLYLMCVVKIVITFDLKTGYIVACVAWRFWLGALSNKGGRGQRNREEIGAGAT